MSDTINLVALLATIQQASPHILTARERGERDGYHGGDVAEDSYAYHRGYVYGVACRARLEEVRRHKLRDDSLRVAAPDHWGRSREGTGSPGKYGVAL